MYILKDLWYGNISPFEKTFRPDSEYARLLNRFVEQSEAITAGLSDEDRLRFEACQDTHDALSEISQTESFIEGFRLGAKTVLDVLGADTI